MATPGAALTSEGRGGAVECGQRLWRGRRQQCALLGRMGFLGAGKGEAAARHGSAPVLAG